MTPGGLDCPKIVRAEVFWVGILGKPTTWRIIPGFGSVVHDYGYRWNVPQDLGLRLDPFHPWPFHGLQMGLLTTYKSWDDPPRISTSPLLKITSSRQVKAENRPKAPKGKDRLPGRCILH